MTTEAKSVRRTGRGAMFLATTIGVVLMGAVAAQKGSVNNQMVEVFGPTRSEEFADYLAERYAAGVEITPEMRANIDYFRKAGDKPLHEAMRELEEPVAGGTAEATPAS